MSTHGLTATCGRCIPIAEFDPVDRPEHYQTDAGFECKDVIREAIGVIGYIYFCIGNVIKYLFRFKKKNGIEDIRKALWYLTEAVNLIGDGGEWFSESANGRSCSADS